VGGFCLASCTPLLQMEFLEQGIWEPQHHTLKELRDRHVVKQQEDYSCGAAALATLLIYYFGEDTSEKEVLSLLEGELSEEDKKLKKERGFSLLDLKLVAQKKGYRAAGYKVTMSQLSKVSAPVMVFLEPLGYKHFAVYRGIDRGRVYVADPARGNLQMSIGRFLDEWSGIIFVLGKDGQEQITEHALKLPHALYIQPELARMNGQIDIGFMTQTLPQR
jgi:predicted double-glycine peptidase